MEDFTAPGAAVSGYPFRYTGRFWDTETELFHYRARYYDPRDGRFAETDPLGLEGGMNLYAYCLNDPLGCTDPMGAEPEWVTNFRYFLGESMRTPDQVADQGGTPDEIRQAAINQTAIEGSEFALEAYANANSLLIGVGEVELAATAGKAAVTSGRTAPTRMAYLRSRQLALGRT